MEIGIDVSGLRVQKIGIAEDKVAITATIVGRCGTAISLAPMSEDDWDKFVAAMAAKGAEAPPRVDVVPAAALHGLGKMATGIKT